MVRFNSFSQYLRSTFFQAILRDVELSNVWIYSHNSSKFLHCGLSDVHVLEVNFAIGASFLAVINKSLLHHSGSIFARIQKPSI